MATARSRPTPPWVRLDPAATRSSRRCRTPATTSTSRPSSSPCRCGPGRAPSSRSCSSGRATGRNARRGGATPSSSTPAGGAVRAGRGGPARRLSATRAPSSCTTTSRSGGSWRWPACSPTSRRALDAVAGRLVDLLRLTRDHYQHPALNGSFSLKNVLPDGGRRARPCPARRGAGRPLRPGGLPRGVDPATEEDRRETLCRSLLEYCGLDTLALVRVAHRFATADAVS